MELLIFLIVFPLISALMLLCIRNNQVRKIVVYTSATVTALASIVLAGIYFPQGTVTFHAESDVISVLFGIIDVLIGAVVIGYAIRYKRPLAGILAAILVLLTVNFELFVASNVSTHGGLYVDPLTLIMVLVIGVVGSGICIYSLGYMEDFQAHEPEGAPDRRPKFFALMFVFLSAMYLIVFSDNLVWLFTGWEVTTVCSFLLIGYTKTDEAIKSAFRQIIINTLGGIAFILGLYIIVIFTGNLSLSMLFNGGVPYVAFALLAIAGLTKAAQMPFHTWLLGAMVAPTPTSALLHSSTMVKAGVFLLLKLSPVMGSCLPLSTMLVMIGTVTFFLCSCMAISQTNAKRVLAYSTIANLGLITACAGVGNSAALWAAVILLVIHAVAKSLLFLCVGTAEHHIGSRDIEDMDLLFERMPGLARFMMLGIMCMFIAPFGMLIAKWATLNAFLADGQLIALMLLAFGSAVTFMFWAKWLGKLSAIAGPQKNVEQSVHKSEWFSTLLMVFLVIASCVLLPLMSSYMVAPALTELHRAELTYLSSSSLGLLPDGVLTGIIDDAVSNFKYDVGSDNLWIAAILCALICIVLFVGVGRRSKKRQLDVYMAGITAKPGERQFINSMGMVSEATSRNWYMKDFFKEKSLKVFGEVASIIVISLCLLGCSIADYTSMLLQLSSLL